jgi:sialic acid synthase SpsE
MTPYILAEIASAHDGSLRTIKDMIRVAGAVGADGVKLQIWAHSELPESEYKANMAGIEFSVQEWTGIIKHALDHFDKDDIWAEFYGSASAHIFSNQVGQIKVSSANAAEICSARGGNVWWRNGLEHLGGGYDGICIGQQLRPTPIKDSQIRNIKQWAQQRPVLYADHTDSKVDSVPICAMAMTFGASVIEKHFTLNSQIYGRDSVSALTPTGFKAFAEKLNELSEAL